MSSGKSPVSDSIQAEVYAAGGPLAIGKLTKMYQTMWNQEEIKQEFKDAAIVHLYKWKGNRWACDNHRGLSLLTTAVEILARILLSNLNKT